MEQQPDQRRGCIRRGARIAGTIAGIVVVLLIFTTVRASILDAGAFDTIPDTSLLVDIGGRNIHMVAMGMENDGPAVVLLPCLGCGSGVWRVVQSELSDTIRTYAYEPAGFGWSDPYPGTLSMSQSADDLHAALTALGEDEVILVAFSGSGLTAHFYLSRYTEPRVLGIVSIEMDTFGENGEAVFGDYNPLPPSIQRPAIALGLSRVLVEAAMMPASRQYYEDYADRMIDPEGADLVLKTLTTRRSHYAGVDMQATYAEASAAAADLAIPAGIPVFALDADYADERPDPGSKAEADFLAGEAFRAGIWRTLAESSPGGRYIVVANSSHMIPMDQPQATVDAIRAMVDLVQGQ
ncbi:MAG: alpha/beta hydrolase [Anaerolineae bacterium]|nr:alpha/beta hydrolase [Anaerolineae bacterium]